jgi:transposase
LYGWRRKLCARRTAPDFAPVQIIGATAAPGAPAPVGVIEIELAGGTRLRITGAVDAATVSAAVGALAAKERRS